MHCFFGGQCVFVPTIAKIFCAFFDCGEGGGTPTTKLFPKFTQTTASPVFANGAFAEQTIGDVAAALESGAISPSRLPIDVIDRGGHLLGLNTRSMLALRRAGIPVAQWTIIDRTGQPLYEQLLDERRYNGYQDYRCRSIR